VLFCVVLFCVGIKEPQSKFGVIWCSFVLFIVSCCAIFVGRSLDPSLVYIGDYMPLVNAGLNVSPS
jgi:hypothetical protein